MAIHSNENTIIFKSQQSINATTLCTTLGAFIHSTFDSILNMNSIENILRYIETGD